MDLTLPEKEQRKQPETNPRQVLSQLVTLFENAPETVTGHPAIARMLGTHAQGEFQKTPVGVRALEAVVEIRQNHRWNPETPENQEIRANLEKAARKIIGVLFQTNTIPQPDPLVLEKLRDESDILGFTIHEYSTDGGSFAEEIKNGELEQHERRNRFVTAIINWMQETPEIQAFEKAVEALQQTAFENLSRPERHAILLNRKVNEMEREADDFQSIRHEMEDPENPGNETERFFEKFAKLAEKRDQVTQQKLLAEALINHNRACTEIFQAVYPGLDPKKHLVQHW